MGGSNIKVTIIFYQLIWYFYLTKIKYREDHVYLVFLKDKLVFELYMLFLLFLLTVKQYNNAP